jgi:hypothetical protein
MALINKSTFEIIDGTALELIPEDIREDYFEVDDLIALSVSELNKRGYTTTYCCSGHPFEGLVEVFSAKIYDLRSLGICTNVIRQGDFYRGICRSISNECYITFYNDPSVFKCLPKGFYIDGFSIRRTYLSKCNTFEYVEEIVESMKDLFIWTQSLEVII